MSLLQLFFILSGIVLLYVGLDVARKQKFNALHFLVFIGTGLGLVAFTFFPSALNVIGRVFGLPRGADVLVYGAIVFLVYFVMLLLSKAEDNGHDVTRLVRELALSAAGKPAPAAASGRRPLFLVRAYNEEKRVADTLRALLATGLGPVLAVNDGSKDGTAAAVASVPGVHLVSHPFNRGGGAALETGLEWARRNADALGATHVVTFDADGQHSVADLPKFLAAFDVDPSLDVVFGSRFIGDTGSNVPPLRRAVLWGGRIFTWMVSRIMLTDSHNGYRMIAMAAVKRIRLTMDGMEYASELVEQVRYLKLKFSEVPVTIRYDEYSLGKGQRSSNAINIALKMIWRKISR